MAVTGDARAEAPARPRTGWFVAFVVLCLVVAHGFSASATRCAGFVEDGRFFDSDGQPTEFPPECLAVSMGPNGWVVWAIIFAALVVMFRARRLGDPARGQALLDRAMMTIAVVTVASIGLAMLWWSQVDILAWEPGEPMPFTTWPLVGSVEVDITPIEAAQD